MPNELKNALKASISHVTTNHTMSRQLPVAGSSTVSVMVWTISGIVLASCGGGGGGGAGGSGLSVSGSGSNGDGGGGGSSASGPSGNIARVVDGPVKGAAVYFDIDGDGEVSDSEREAQKQNGDPMYITDANGYVNAPIAFEGHFFIANVDNATDTATGDTLSGEYQSLSTGGIATPITDLIADRMRESNADAQGVLDDIFGADGLVTVTDILDAENYKILNLGEEAEKPTLPSDTADAEEQEEYDRTLAKYKTSVIMEASLALSEIDKDDGAFANLVDSPTARVNALKQIIDDDPDNNDTAALAERISDRVAAGREILGRKPLAQPDSSVSPIDEDSVFRFPQGSEDIFGFTDPNGNSDDADTSRFTGIYVKSSVDFPQADAADASAHTVNLLYNGSPLSGHRVARGDSLPGNLPPEAGFHYVSFENLSRLSISPSRDDSGTLEVEYYVFDGEQWSDKASLEITVSPVDDPATDVAVGAQDLTAIDENTVTTGMKVADLRVDDADGPPHRLEVRGDNTGFFEIRNEDELWLVVNTGETLDYETTRTLAVQVGVSGDIDITPVNITVAVNNLNDNAPVISLEGGQNQVQNPLDEGLYSIDTDTGYRYTASDADGGTSTLRVSGDDQDRFRFDASGKLQIKAGAEFDYETPADRAITLTITATDSGVGLGSSAAATHEVTITFGDVNEASPEQPPLEDNIDSGDAHFSIFSYGRQAISAETGAVLTATEVTPDPDIDAAAYSYQWYHIGAGTSGADDDIAGATSRSYTVADTDEGKRIGVRVRYAENSFQSDGTTPTGTETIAAELPPIVDFTKIRDISSEVRYSYSGPFALVASISTKETGDHLILYEIRSNSRSVFDTTNPHRATITSPETGSVYVYEISGVDKDSFMLVQNGSNIYIVSRTGFNYENPTDSDQDNNYEITLTNSTRFVPPISYALTITNDTSEAQVKVATASIIETSSSIKFTSLEDAVRAYSGIDDALLRHSATFGGAVVDGANPHRATVTFKVAGLNDIVFTYELSGDDVNDVRLVQDGNDVSLITVAGLDYENENPADEDEMNTYSVVETITTISPNVPSRYRDVQTTYTLSVTENLSDYNVEIYENHPLHRSIEIDSVDLQEYQLTEGYVDNALFTIDAIGQIWWKATPDYEAPRDGDGDNLYEIELYRTNSTGQTHRVQVDIRVNDLGANLAPGEEYDPDIRITPNHIPDEHLPRDFVQHLLLIRTWEMPATGPLIITYSIDQSLSGRDRFNSALDKVLLSYEQAANLKFVEVNPRDPDEYNDHVLYITMTIGRGSYVDFPLKTAEHITAIINFESQRFSAEDTAQRVITHELGHALGLAHPFATERGWPGNRDYLQSTLSVMAYNHNVIALQPADIEALQFLYGAPGTDFMGAESFALLRGEGFATRFVDELQTLTEIDANTDLTAGIKVAEFATHGFGTFEIVGDYAEFFDLRIRTPDEITELWLTLEEDESLENIDTLEVYVRIAEKYAVRTEDITITVNNVGSSGAGSSDRTSGVVGDAGQIKIDEMLDEGQSVIANLVDLELGEIDLTEITIGGDDKDQVQIRQTQNGGVLEFVSAPDFEAPEDDDEDNVYEITLYDDLTSIEVDVTVIDIPEL